MTQSPIRFKTEQSNYGTILGICGRGVLPGGRKFGEAREIWIINPETHMPMPRAEQVILKREIRRRIRQSYRKQAQAQG
jgi:hypothetical protein